MSCPLTATIGSTQKQLPSPDKSTSENQLVITLSEINMEPNREEESTLKFTEEQEERSLDTAFSNLKNWDSLAPLESKTIRVKF